MRISVYGGSFNPPHVGHAMVASWLRWTDQADEVRLVPVHRHAFEGLHDKTLAPFGERLEWCRAMARELGPWVVVDDVEARLSGPSYSIDTLRHLAATEPEHTFRFVVGADSLPQLPKWRAWEDIEAEFSPIIVGRQGHPPGLEPTVDFPDVSSTEVRARLAAGQPIDHLLTAEVARLVRRYWSASRTEEGT